MCPHVHPEPRGRALSRPPASRRDSVPLCADWQLPALASALTSATRCCCHGSLHQPSCYPHAMPQLFPLSTFFFVISRVHLHLAEKKTYIAKTGLLETSLFIYDFCMCTCRSQKSKKSQHAWFNPVDFGDPWMLNNWGPPHFSKPVASHLTIHEHEGSESVGRQAFMYSVPATRQAVHRHWRPENE